MYANRRVLVRSGSEWSSPYSRYLYHYMQWSHCPVHLRYEDVETLDCWDDLHKHNGDEQSIKRWENIIARLRGERPSWLETPGSVIVSHLERWMRMADPNVLLNDRDMDCTWRANTIRQKQDAFNAIPIADMEPHPFVEAFVSALEKYDVVYGVVPSGFGKSVAARLVIDKFIDRKTYTSTVRRGAMDRPTWTLTKSIHVTPSASTAESTAKFLIAQHDVVWQPAVAGYPHAMMDHDGNINPVMDHVDHVMLPAIQAERFLDVARARVVVIDEVQVGNSSAYSCLISTLNGMASEWNETDNLEAGVPRRRFDRCLILSGSNSPTLQIDIHRLLLKGFKRLSFHSVIIPSDPDIWKARRHRISRNILRGHLNPPPSNANLPLRTPLSDELSRLLCWRDNVFTDTQIDNEDVEFTKPTGGKLEFIIKRITCAVITVIKLFKDDAIRAKNDYIEKRRILDNMESGRVRSTACELNEYRERILEIETSCHRFPTIIIFVPSTGTAKTVDGILFGLRNTENLLEEEPGDIFDHTVCSRTTDSETEMTDGTPEELEFRNRDGVPIVPSAKSTFFGGGKILIVVNGCELGLTIPVVGAIVESGVERIISPPSRSGISSYSFVRSDFSLIDQREGRGGRTRDAHHILCVGPRAFKGIYRAPNRSHVIDRIRMNNNTIVDFLRQYGDPTKAYLRVFHSDVWNETTVGGLVAGVLEEDAPSDLEETSVFGVLDVRPAPYVGEMMRLFPGVNPTLAQS